MWISALCLKLMLFRNAGEKHASQCGARCCELICHDVQSCCCWQKFAGSAIAGLFWSPLCATSVHPTATSDVLFSAILLCCFPAFQSKNHSSALLVVGHSQFSVLQMWLEDETWQNQTNLARMLLSAVQEHWGGPQFCTGIGSGINWLDTLDTERNKQTAWVLFSQCFVCWFHAIFQQKRDVFVVGFVRVRATWPMGIKWCLKTFLSTGCTDETVQCSGHHFFWTSGAVVLEAQFPRLRVVRGWKRLILSRFVSWLAASHLQQHEKHWSKASGSNVFCVQEQLCAWLLFAWSMHHASCIQDTVQRQTGKLGGIWKPSGQEWSNPGACSQWVGGMASGSAWLWWFHWLESPCCVVTLSLVWCSRVHQWRRFLLWLLALILTF